MLCWKRLNLVVASLGLCFKNSEVTAWLVGKIHQERNFHSVQMEFSLFLKACEEGASTTSAVNNSEGEEMPTQTCVASSFFQLMFVPLVVDSASLSKRLFSTLYSPCVYFYLMSQLCHPFPDGTSYLAKFMHFESFANQDLRPGAVFVGRLRTPLINSLSFW